MKEKVVSSTVPRVIGFTDELPMSAVGKVLKLELRINMVVCEKRNRGDDYKY